jgi:hypothetical protein
MKQSSLILAKSFTYCGTLPIIASALSIYFPVAGFDTAFIAQTYSAIIILFLCGIHWAAYLFFADKCPRNLLIASNIVALLAWASLLVMYRPITTLLQVLCFLYLLTLKLRDAGIISKWFYALRRNATIIVVVCLTILAGLS